MLRFLGFGQMNFIRFFSGLACLLLAGAFGCLLFAAISIRQSPYPIVIHFSLCGLALDDWTVIVTSGLLTLAFGYAAIYLFFCGRPRD